MHVVTDAVVCSVYDPMIGDRLLKRMERRPRGSFDFVQEGRFQKQAELQRLRVSLINLTAAMLLAGKKF